MIGIIVAMEKELAALSIENAKTENVGGIRFILGTICRHPVVAAVSGVGKVFAAMCTQTMLLTYEPVFIINCGVAGALSDALHLFDIAIGTAAVQYDMDTSPLGDPVGLISGLNLVELPCAPALVKGLTDAATKAGLSAKVGLLATGDRFCASEEDKKKILSHFPAIACEMEGGAVAQVCAAQSVPCVLFRAISDGADTDATVSYETFAVKAAENTGKLLTVFLENMPL